MPDRDTTRLDIATGVVCTAVIAITGAHIGYLFPAEHGFEWWFHFRVAADPGVYEQNATLAVLYLAVLLLCRAWLRLMRRSRQPGGVRARTVMLAFALWCLPLLVAPPLFSTDAFAYAADGHLQVVGFNPYHSPVSVLGSGPFLMATHPMWRPATAAYGPLALQLNHVAAMLSGDGLIPTVLVLRLMALSGLVALGFACVGLARGLGQPAAPALALVLLNPIVILHLLGGAHNDAVVVALLTVGLAAALVHGRWLLGIAVCSAAAMVKQPGALVALYLGAAWCAGATTAGRRLGRGVAALSVAVAVVVGVTVVCGYGWGWLGASGVPGRSLPLLAPTVVVGRLLEPLGLPGVPIARAAGMIAALAVAVALLARPPWRRAWRGGPAAAAARADGAAMPAPADVMATIGVAMLAAAALGPTLYPWYLTWALVPVAFSGVDSLRRVVVIASLVLAFTNGPAGGGALDGLSYEVGALPVAVGVAVVAVVALGIGRRRLGGGAASRPAGGAALPERTILGRALDRWTARPVTHRETPSAAAARAWSTAPPIDGGRR